MKPITACLALILAAAALGAGGCQWTAPYVYNSSEFDRNAVGFGKEIEDRDAVSICYNSRGTTAAAVAKMAADECGKFGKVARYEGQDYLECPIMTPARVTFSCVEP